MHGGDSGRIFNVRGGDIHAVLKRVTVLCLVRELSRIGATSKCKPLKFEGGARYACGEVPQDQQAPQRIGTETDWQSVACGAFHTMATKRSAALNCVNDGSPRTIPNFATNIQSGPPGEPAQTVAIQVTATRISGSAVLFSSPPAISTTGTLTFTPLTGAAGEAEVAVKLQDSGGTANGGVDTSAEQKFKIRIISNGVKASTVGAGTIDLVNKVLINDTNGPLTLANAVTMGGTSTLDTLPGQGFTFTGPCTFTTPLTNLNTCGEAEIQCAQFSAALAGVLAQINNTGPGKLELAPTATLPTDLNFCKPTPGASSTVDMKIASCTSNGAVSATSVNVSKNAAGNVVTTSCTHKVAPGSSPGKLSGVNGSLEAAGHSLESAARVSSHGGHRHATPRSFPPQRSGRAGKDVEEVLEFFIGVRCGEDGGADFAAGRELRGKHIHILRRAEDGHARGLRLLECNGEWHGFLQLRRCIIARVVKAPVTHQLLHMRSSRLQAASVPFFDKVMLRGSQLLCSTAEVGADVIHADGDVAMPLWRDEKPAPLHLLNVKPARGSSFDRLGAAVAVKLLRVEMRDAEAKESEE